MDCYIFTSEQDCHGLMWVGDHIRPRVRVPDSWHGLDVAQGWPFHPAVKVSYDFTRKISGGTEYYADYGRLGQFDSLHQQQQQIIAVTDLNVSPKWEINFGVGVVPRPGQII